MLNGGVEVGRSRCGELAGGSTREKRGAQGKTHWPSPLGGKMDGFRAVAPAPRHRETSERSGEPPGGDTRPPPPALHAPYPARPGLHISPARRLTRRSRRQRRRRFCELRVLEALRGENALSAQPSRGARAPPAGTMRSARSRSSCWLVSARRPGDPAAPVTAGRAGALAKMYARPTPQAGAGGVPRARVPGGQPAAGASPHLRRSCGSASGSWVCSASTQTPCPWHQGGRRPATLSSLLPRTPTQHAALPKSQR